MSNETHKPNSHGHADYERRDIGVAGVLYFIIGLVFAGILVHFIVTGLFGFLNRKYETEQPPVSPLVKNAPADTRRIPSAIRQRLPEISEREFPVAPTGNRRALSVERHSLARGRHAEHLRMGRSEGGYSPHPDRPRHRHPRATRSPGAQPVRRSRHAISQGAAGQSRREVTSEQFHEPGSHKPFVTRQAESKEQLSSYALLSIALLATSALGQSMSKGIMSPPASVRPPYLQNVGIEQHLDGQVPADLQFTDDTGRSVKLGDYFGKKPLILNLVYYNCTMLCGEALAGLTGSMKMIKFDVGNQFDVVTVSFNPKETTQDAAAKKADYLKRYGRPGAASGWHFLDWFRRFDQRTDQGRRIPVSIRRRAQPVCACHGHHGTHAAGPHFALLLWRRFSAERLAHGTRRGLAGEDRKRRRPGSLVLLSLRSRHRKVRSGRHQHAEARRWRHRFCFSPCCCSFSSDWIGPLLAGAGTTRSRVTQD